MNQFDVSHLLAMSSALAQPAWLEKDERFSLSGGVGFSSEAFALGVTGIVRIQGSLAGYGGFAYSPDRGLWAGRVGARVGW
jgi:hypothetical protein